MTKEACITKHPKGLSVFERYLTLWIILCIVAGIILGKVTGVILLAAAKTGATVLEIPVREAKKILTGNGNANKSQLESAVRHLLQHPEQIKPDHASDAIALAIIGQIRYEKAK